MKIILLLLFLIASPTLIAQQAKQPLHEIWEKSLPFITNYTTDDYKAALQNWALVQADNGLMYAANNYGVLEYDGSSWRLIKTPEGNPVRSLAKDSSGRIYTGGSGEIGYLAPDTRNEMVFHSIRNKLDKRNWDFGSVWFTFAQGKSVYFVCDLYVLEWSGGKFNVWKSDIGSLGFAWLVNGALYVSVSNRGLMKKDRDGLVPVEGGRQFNGMGLMGLFPYDKTRMLAVGTRKEFYIYDGKKLEPFKRNGVNVKIPDAVYHGTQLSNGDYALATTGSGFYLMDREGNIKNNICRKEGLTSDAVYAVLEDAEGDLWLGTDNGISRLEINSPLRVLTEKHGLDENPFDIEFYDNTLYTVNSKGLFQLNKSASNGIAKLSFKKLKGIDNLTLHCQNIGNELIVSNYDGIFSLNKNGRMSEIAQENVVRVEEWHTAEAPQHLMVGLEGYGLTEILNINGQWKPGKKRLDLKVYAESFARGANGNIFLNTRRNGIYEMIWKKPSPNHTLADEFTLKHYHAANGLS